MVDPADANNKPKSAQLDLLLESSRRSIKELCKELGRALVRREFNPDEPPPHFGRYEVRGVLGTGGFGAVFRAWDPGLDREVAIKLCARDPQMDAALLLSEARTLAQLSHPNIVTVHDFGTDGDRLYLVLEYVDGGSLYRYTVKGQPETWQELVEVFADAARGVAAAHDKGVVHGDIKPDNVLLHEDHRPKVADFGLARMVGKQTLMPRAIGTLPYAAPELLAGQVRDELSDQWSFFVTLCHCIDSKLPIIDTYARELPSTDEKMLEAIKNWAGPSTLHMLIPDELAEVLRVGLSYERLERFADMHAVAHALDGVLASGLLAGALLEPAVADHVVVEPRAETPPSPRRGWKTAGLMALLLGLGLGLVGEAYLVGQRASRAELAHNEPRPLDSAERPSPPAKSAERPSPPAKSAERLSPLDTAEQPSPLDTAERPSSLDTAELDNAERPNSDQRPPCVADGVPIEPDASVRSMCRMLRTEGYKAAVDLWKELANSRARDARSAHDWLKLACDTIVLAQTFLHEAETADPEQAMQISEAAEQLARFAGMYLGEITNDEETAEAVSLVKKIVAGLTETNNN